jgi:hypothetical protein
MIPRLDFKKESRIHLGVIIKMKNRRKREEDKPISGFSQGGVL